MERIGRLGWIQLDCDDPRRLAAFWGAVCGLEIDSALGASAHYVVLAAEPNHLRVSFQRVPEPKTMKNRLLFDILVEDVE